MPVARLMEGATDHGCGSTAAWRHPTTSALGSCPMLSKLVADREQSARVVVAAFETHGPQATCLLAELLAEGL